MADNSVIIKIDGDDSGLQSTLGGIGKKAKVSLADVKAGFDMATQAAQKLADACVKVYAGFDDSMRQVQATMNASAEETERLTAAAREAGATTRYTAAQSADALNYLALAGYNAEEAIASLPVVLQLAQAGGIDLAYASDLLTDSMASLGKGIDDMEGFADQMAVTSQKSNTNVAQLGEAILTVGGTAKALKGDTVELNTALGILADNGIKGAEGGTALRNMMLSLTAPTSAATKQLKKLGVDVYDAQGNMRGLNEIFADLDKGMAKFTDEQRAAALSDIFNKRDLKSAEAMLANYGDRWNELSGYIQQADGASKQMADTMEGGLGGSIRSLQSALEAVEISMGESLSAPIKSAIDDITGILRDAAEGVNGEEIITRLINGAAKKLPTAIQKLTSALPGLIRSGLSNIMPNLVTNVFEAAGQLVGNVITMLPELVPALADGILNMISSVFTGIDRFGTEIFNGIEKLFHQGQEKIAGVWVDSENVKKYKIGLEAEVDTSEAETSIKTAYSTLRAALQTDLLTDEQKAEIIQMIGDDYDAIKAKLMEFGLSEEEADALATQVSEAGDSLVKAYEGLNVGIDATTLARLTAQANGSRIVLKGLLKDVGLSDSDISQVVSVYDTMTGKLGDQTPSIMEEIYDKLTDGKPDDEQTVSALKEKIQTYIDGLLTELESTYAAKSAELDTTADDYKEKKAALDEWYNSTKTQITDMNTGMVALVDELAGAPTAVVEARMAEFAEMERTLLGIEDKIDDMTAKARTAAENAFQVVRSGANADEETISMAINLKATEFKIDEQSAEDAYSAAVEDLNAKLASGEISKEEYDTQLESAQGDLEAAKAAAKAAYEKALGEIFAGIAESEGNDAALQQAMDAVNVQNMIADMLTNMFDENNNIDTEKLAGVSEAIKGVLGEAFDTSNLMFAAEENDSAGLTNMLDIIAAQIDGASSDAIETALSGKVGEAYRAAFSSGVLAGTEFDTEEPAAQLSAIITGIAQSAAPAAKAAGQSLGEETTSDMADAEGAQKAGNETVKGLDIALARAEALARRRGRLAGRAFAAGYKQAQLIASPSKVMMQLGRFSAEGLDEGLREAMTKAVATAKMLSGQIVTAADFSQTLRVNVPNLNQEIKLANEQSSVPVNLDGQRIAEIQGLNNATRIEFLHRQDAKGYGL